jgi:hypothetical protein
VGLLTKVTVPLIQEPVTEFKEIESENHSADSANTLPAETFGMVTVPEELPHVT